MTDTAADTYQGYVNRETWAFHVHWSNDYGLYTATLALAEHYLTETYGRAWRELPPDELKAAAYGVGGHLRDYWRDRARGHGVEDVVSMMNTEVGSWWRVDPAETGEAIIESLDTEA